MKIVIRAALKRFELAPADDRPERAGRRSITFSPTGGARVILRERSSHGRQAEQQLAGVA
jgi:cytochrome P450